MKLSNECDAESTGQCPLCMKSFLGIYPRLSVLCIYPGFFVRFVLLSTVIVGSIAAGIGRAFTLECTHHVCNYKIEFVTPENFQRDRLSESE
ncbi:unnamed protein product [Hermetia illucens]|uniref:Uncharacterized protein n=1 Tax=Hermetia illucens TaxID=343691 RepID=A0A7R8YS85_HERIL|nr:unnamed protein product [Hermetia illucens]